MVITLIDEEFATVCEHLHREHTATWNPDHVGLTTKIGKRLWDRVQEIADVQECDPASQVA